MGDRRPFAALLLNYRQPEPTLVCLSDLLRSAPGARTLVIDNGSGEDDVRRLEGGIEVHRARGRDVEMLALPANEGFGAAMNRGLDWASARGCEYALLLNNDLRLPAGFHSPLVDVLENDPSVAAVGPTILRPDGLVWAQGGSFAFRPNGVLLRGQGRPPAPRHLGPRLVDFLPGACVLLRLSAARKVGGFDPRYFLYMEDVDLCDRLREAGGKILWLPWVRVTHDPGTSSGGGRSPLRKFMMGNHLVLFLRARGTVRRWASFAVCDLLGFPLALLLDPRSAAAKMRGVSSGLLGRRADATDVARYLS
ncbi:MAG: glycosyltransferase family 2 protein [Planctomycetota bacterium]